MASPHLAFAEHVWVCHFTHSWACCRFALAIQPKNYLLFACHACNECVQLNLLRRWYFAHYGSASNMATQLDKAA